MALFVNSNLALELPADRPSIPSQAKSDPRAELAAQFIPAGARVLDLGASPALRSLLPNGCDYATGARAGKKGQARALDLNIEEFPSEAASRADVIVMLGMLERIKDVESLFTHLRFCKRGIILSCYPADFAKIGERAQDLVNRMSLCDLALLFNRYGFRIESTAPVDESQMLMRLTPAERLSPVATCNVAVISGGDTNDLAARLGRQLINAVLPGECRIHHLTAGTIDQARRNYDLVILGAGGSLFPPLLGDGVLDVVSRAKSAIGIFGTQSRELIARPAFDRILDRLDTWFARYEDDVLIYGRGRNNVFHAGDWLIDQFPLARATNDEPLVVNGDLGPEFALDRAISTIQQHRQVYSTVPVALLCALTAAELAAYAELPAQQPDLSAGHFRSMLVDVFGRSWPQQKFFLVDRDAVIRYKTRVHQNVLKMGARIAAILQNVAAAA
ncbi:MAG TPA: methyltransferase domain-containing protein [Gammaproteobacteria bacterium]|nr:methyltransferase domain-containing protein [Gammaproteobacteria bacterium]